MGEAKRRQTLDPNFGKTGFYRYVVRKSPTVPRWKVELFAGKSRNTQRLVGQLPLTFWFEKEHAEIFGKEALKVARGIGVKQIHTTEGILKLFSSLNEKFGPCDFFIFREELPGKSISLGKKARETLSTSGRATLACLDLCIRKMNEWSLFEEPTNASLMLPTQTKRLDNYIAKTIG